MKKKKIALMTIIVATTAFCMQSPNENIANASTNSGPILICPNPNSVNKETYMFIFDKRGKLFIHDVVNDVELPGYVLEGDAKGLPRINGRLLRKDNITPMGNVLQYILVNNNQNEFYFIDKEDVMRNRFEDTYTVGTNSSYGVFNNVHRYFLNECDSYYAPLFYTKTGDDTHLYARAHEPYSFKTGAEYKNYCMPLPEGYTADNIKEVYAAREILLFMNNGTAYVRSSADSECDWELNAELSTSSVIDISITNNMICALLENGVIYKINE